MIYICDTCILIDYLRGKTEVKQKLEKDREQGIGMSSITFMELMVGAFNKKEITIIKKAFSDFEIIEVSESISIKAKNLIEKYSKSHGLLIPDALIGATALELDLPLYTSNVKDFQFIPGITLIK
jgi:predicted nucleic acid-binding protein